MKRKRVLSMALCALMLVSLLPVSALAAETFTLDGFTYSVNDDGVSVTLTGADESCSGELAVPATVTYGGKSYTVTKIGEYAFHQHTDITGVTLPESVTSIGAWAFAESGLTSFSFPADVTEVPDHCFSGCASLSSVTLAPETTTIGIEAFASTLALTELELPAALKFIRMDAFLPQDREQPILTLYYMGTSMDWKSVTQYFNEEDVKSLLDPTAQSLFVKAIVCHDAHDFSNGGVCTCGESVAASITLADGSTTTYYKTLADALALVSEANGGDYAGCTVRLLRSVTEPGIPLSGAGVNCTIDLGGFTFESSNSDGFHIHTNAVVTIQNGSITAQNSGGVRANTAAQVTLKNVSTPTVEPAHADASIALDSTCTLTSHVRLTAGELRLNGAPAIAGFNGSQIVVTSGMVTVNGELGSTVYKVSGGSEAAYPLPFAKGGDGITLDPQNFASAAEGYYVGRNAAGGLSLIEGSCSHAETDNDGHCDVCGVSFAAKITVDTADPVYYTEMPTALSEWSQHTEQTTLTLLHDGVYDSTSPLGLSGNHILDLNGCTLTMKGQGTIQLDTNAELRMKDSSSAQDGRYEGRITLVGDNTSFTLDSGHIDYSENAVAVNDNDEKSRQITVNGGSITNSGHCINGNGHYAKIQINGGTLSSTNGYSVIRLGIVTLKEPATVFMASSDANAIAVHRLTIEGTPNIRGRLCYSSDTELVDLSGYTGDGLDIKFDAGYDGGNTIKLPTNYGLFKNDVEITEVTSGVATVKPIHVHSWSFSAEGAVITATCGGRGTCPVENGSATITLKAPVDPVYNGSRYDCTVEQSVDGLFADVDAGDIVYSAEPVGAGVCTATYTYEGAEATVSFTIAPLDISGRTIDAIPDQAYTGSPIVPDVTVNGAGGFTVNCSNNTNVGTADVTVTGAGNYTGSLSGTFRIVPAVLTPTVTLDKTEFPYTGTVAQPGVTVTASFGGSTITLTKDTDYTVTYGQETAVGSSVAVTISPVSGSNYSFAETAAHYTIGKAIPVYSIPSGLSAVYGQTLAQVTLPTADNGTWSWVEGSAPVGAVGSRGHMARFTPTDNVNFDTADVTVNVEVKPQTLTVVGVTAPARTYDGTANLPVTEVTLNGVVSGDEVAVELSGLKGVLSGSAVGTYTELTLPALSLGGTDAANYTLTQPGKVSGSFTIEPKTVTPTVVVAAGSYVYNGKAHTPAVTVKDGSTVISASEYSVRYDYNVNAGTGRVYVEDKSGGNYVVNAAEGTFTITQALITITADNKTATVGQKAPTPTYSTSGVVAGESFRVLPIVEYVSKPDMSKTGTTIIRASSAVAPSDNYTIKYVDGTLTVKAASATGGSGYYGNVAVTVDMSDVKLESKTYDGKPLSYSGKASARYYYGDFTYTWYTANGYRLGEAPTDAGDYVLRATVSRSGYSGYASKNVSIRKAQLTITADDISAQVGDELPKLSYSVKGLAAGDKLKAEPTVSYETQPDMDKAGKTPILVSGATAPDSKNYEKTIKYIEGTLIVNKAAAGSESSAEPQPETTPAPMLKLEVSVGEENKALDKELDSKESAFYDLALQSSEDGGQSWNAASEQLPEGGVKVSLPLPEGSDENCSFRIIHEGGEYPVTVSKHEDGKYYLDFTASELGTVAVGWTAPGKDGGFPWWLLVSALVLTGTLGGGYALYRRRRSV